MRALAKAASDAGTGRHERGGETEFHADRESRMPNRSGVHGQVLADQIGGPIPENLSDLGGVALSAADSE
jgi:hypothetical protein